MTVTHKRRNKRNEPLGSLAPLAFFVKTEPSQQRNDTVAVLLFFFSPLRQETFLLRKQNSRNR